MLRGGREWFSSKRGLYFLNFTYTYKQMPYEGISKEEYERRQALMPQIDWTRFGGSDGMESRFCSNDTCEI